MRQNANAMIKGAGLRRRVTLLTMTLILMMIKYPFLELYEILMERAET